MTRALVLFLLLVASAAHATTEGLSPNSQTVSLGDVADVTVVVVGGADQIDAVEADFSFNNTIIQVSSITSINSPLVTLSDIFNNGSGEVDLAHGSLSCGCHPPVGCDFGTFTIATIHFSTLSIGTSPLHFLGTSNILVCGVSSFTGGVDGSITVAAATPTRTPVSTSTATATSTATGTRTPTLTPTITATQTITPTRTLTRTPTSTATATLTSTAGNTATATGTAVPTNTPTTSPTGVPSGTSTATVSPTLTPTATETSTQTGTPAATSTNTSTPSPSPTNTPSDTPTAIFTGTITGTPTAVFTATITNTPTAVFTGTATNTPTVTDTPTPGTPSVTPTPGCCDCGTDSCVFSPTGGCPPGCSLKANSVCGIPPSPPTASPTPTNTPNPRTATPTVTGLSCKTFTPTPTATAVLTPSNTPHPICLTFTPTPSPTAGPCPLDFLTNTGNLGTACLFTGSYDADNVCVNSTTPMDAIFGGDGHSVTVTFSSNPTLTWSGHAMSSTLAKLTSMRVGALSPVPATADALLLDGGATLEVDPTFGDPPIEICPFSSNCNPQTSCSFSFYDGGFDMVVDALHPPPTRKVLPFVHQLSNVHNP